MPTLSWAGVIFLSMVIGVTNRPFGGLILAAHPADDRQKNQPSGQEFPIRHENVAHPPVATRFLQAGNAKRAKRTIAVRLDP
jgi:hypothetical protein